MESFSIEIPKYMSEMLLKAREASFKSTHDRVRIGAVIAKGRKIVACGANIARSHPLQGTISARVNLRVGRAYLHAEIAAIIRAMKSLSVRRKSFVMYVYREDLNGELAMCKPCRACELAIRESGIIDTVVYTTPLGVSIERINLAKKE